MKKLTLLLLLTLVITSCATKAQKLQADDITLEYNAMTRGSNRNVVVKQGTITTKDVTGAKPDVVTAVTKAQWDELLAAVEKVDLDKIESLKSPTDKRMYDGALTARLTVTTKNKTYKSNSFDHGQPPAEIAFVVNKIIALSDLNNGNR
jgi:hypothetical protein